MLEYLIFNNCVVLFLKWRMDGVYSRSLNFVGNNLRNNTISIDALSYSYDGNFTWGG